MTSKAIVLANDDKNLSEGLELLSTPTSPPEPAPAREPVASDRTDAVDAIFSILGMDLSPEAAAEPCEGDKFTAVDIERSIPWVLHVEDDADFSAGLQRRLGAYGVAVVRAFNGMEGYRSAFLHAPDCILLDFDMPNGQGDYVLRKLKENPVTKDIPAIFITGCQDRMLKQRLLSQGASGFFTKPLEFEPFREVLAQHIDLLSKPCPVT